MVPERLYTRPQLLPLHEVLAEPHVSELLLDIPFKVYADKSTASEYGLYISIYFVFPYWPCPS